MNNSNQPLLKGFFIGASCGLIAGWFGMPHLRAFILGGLTGLLAGATKIYLSRKKQKKENSSP